MFLTTPGRMRRMLAAGVAGRLAACGTLACGFALAVHAAVAQVQAPAEERHFQADPYTAAQQRVELARKASRQAEAELHRVDAEFRDADSAMQAARRDYDASRARRDKARKNLSDAASRSTQAQRGLETEQLAF